MKKYLYFVVVLLMSGAVLMACSDENNENDKSNNNANNTVNADNDGENDDTNEDGDNNDGDSTYTTKYMEIGEPTTENSTIGEFEYVINGIEKIDLPEEEYTEDLAYGLIFDVTITAVDPENIEGEEMMFDELLEADLFKDEEEYDSAGSNDTWGFPELVDIPEETVEKGKTVDGEILMSVYEGEADLDEYQLVFGFGLEALSDKLILEFTPDDFE